MIIDYIMPYLIILGCVLAYVLYNRWNMNKFIQSVVDDDEESENHKENANMTYEQKNLAVQYEQLESLRSIEKMVKVMYLITIISIILSVISVLMAIS